MPGLYFVQGMQFVVVMLIAGLMFKNMGISNDLIARWTSVLGLAWAIKPLWSPFLELARSKKLIAVAKQFTGAAGLALMAVALQLPMYFAASIAVLFLLAYASAMHDIACDGLYLAALDARQQAAYAGWQGALLQHLGVPDPGRPAAGAGRASGEVCGRVRCLVADLRAAGAAAGAARRLQRLCAAGTLNAERADLTVAGILGTLREVVADFLRKPGVWLAMLFIVMFRFAEGQVQTLGPLFLIEAREQGGLGLTTRVGGIYGTAGTTAFLVGSILGGYFTSWLSLKRAMPLLIVAMAVPNIVSYYLSLTLPRELWRIGLAVSVEMLGYGFGFVGMILYIMQAVAPGRFQTAHYALGSGVMQLGFIFSKSISGDVQMAMGYQSCFLWTIACGLPALLLLFVRIPAASQQD